MNIFTEVVAIVSWFSPRPQYQAVGKPVEVWCNDMYESEGVHSFVPLNLFSQPCAHSTNVLNDEHVLFVVPVAE